MPHISPIAYLEDIAIRAALLAAGRADTTCRTKSDGGTRNGTGDGEKSRLWISYVPRLAFDCAPRLHAIFKTVEKAEANTSPTI